MRTLQPSLKQWNCFILSSQSVTHCVYRRRNAIRPFERSSIDDNKRQEKTKIKEE